jgi:hypothetical protein
LAPLQALVAPSEAMREFDGDAAASASEFAFQ